MLTNKTIPLLVSCILLTIGASNGYAAEVDGVQQLSFGRIALHPGGDTLTINATGGPATATAGRSHVEDSYSGYIDFTSSTANEYVTVNYPDDVTLSDGTQDITISSIQSHSQLNNVRTEIPSDGSILRLSIGGELTLLGTENESTYTGSMLITVFFD